MKTYLVFLICALSARQLLAEVKEDGQSWSWNDNGEQLADQVPLEDTIASETLEQPMFNVTNIDDVVDAILDSSRQGRNLKEFDEVYTDPSLQEAIQKGDDNEARNLIRDKLCSLGLMQVSDGGENIHIYIIVIISTLFYSAMNM